MRKHIQSNIDSVINRIKVLSIELGIILLAFVSSTIVVVFLVRQVFWAKKDSFDQAVFELFRGHVSERTTEVMQFFTIFGSHSFLVPANLALIAYSAFIRRDKWFAIKTAVVPLTSLLLMFGLKIFFNRKRPVDPLLQEVSGLSFPSGHALMSFTFFGFLIYMIFQRVKNLWLRTILIILCLGMIIMVCMTRIYLRVHYATDVLAGFSLGIIWLTLSLWILHIIEKNKRKLPPVH
jgi:membrane-associated phospholipid phosphatase